MVVCPKAVAHASRSRDRAARRTTGQGSAPSARSSFRRAIGHFATGRHRSLTTRQKDARRVPRDEGVKLRTSGVALSRSSSSLCRLGGRPGPPRGNCTGVPGFGVQQVNVLHTGKAEPRRICGSPHPGQSPGNLVEWGRCGPARFKCRTSPGFAGAALPSAGRGRARARENDVSRRRLVQEFRPTRNPRCCSTVAPSTTLRDPLAAQPGRTATSLNLVAGHVAINHLDNSTHRWGRRALRLFYVQTQRRARTRRRGGYRALPRAKRCDIPGTA